MRISKQFWVETRTLADETHGVIDCHPVASVALSKIALHIIVIIIVTSCQTRVFEHVLSWVLRGRFRESRVRRPGNSLRGPLSPCEAPVKPLFVGCSVSQKLSAQISDANANPNPSANTSLGLRLRSHSREPDASVSLEIPRTVVSLEIPGFPAFLS